MHLPVCWLWHTSCWWKTVCSSLNASFSFIFFFFAVEQTPSAALKIFKDPQSSKTAPPLFQLLFTECFAASYLLQLALIERRNNHMTSGLFVQLFHGLRVITPLRRLVQGALVSYCIENDSFSFYEVRIKNPHPWFQSKVHLYLMNYLICSFKWLENRTFSPLVADPSPDVFSRLAHVCGRGNKTGDVITINL